MLNSSGGFVTPTATSSTGSSEKTPSVSPPAKSSSSSEHPSSNSIFLLADDDQTSRSEYSSFDKRNFSFDDPFSPGFSHEHFPLPSSSSPSIVRTAPLYISTYSTSPTIPLVKTAHSSSTADDETFFARRSPSPQSVNRPVPQIPFAGFHRYHHSSTSKEQQK